MGCLSSKNIVDIGDILKQSSHSIEQVSYMWDLYQHGQLKKKQKEEVKKLTGQKLEELKKEGTEK